MKIKKVWFGLIVITIVFVILILGYGVYESIFKASEYVRIYQSSVDLKEKEDERNGVYLNNLEVKVIDYFMQKVEDDGDEQDDEQEFYLDIEFKHNDEIILEPSFDYIIYDENNKILARSSMLNQGVEYNKKHIVSFTKEKYNSKDTKVFYDNIIQTGGGSESDIEPDTPELERRIKTYLPKDYELNGKLYVRIFNIKYKIETVTEPIVFNNDMIEFVVENKQK